MKKKLIAMLVVSALVLTMATAALGATFYFHDDADWGDVRAWAWGDGGDYFDGGWPGPNATSIGDGWYSIEITGDISGLTFSGAAGTVQVNRDGENIDLDPADGPYFNSSGATTDRPGGNGGEAPPANGDDAPPPDTGTEAPVPNPKDADASFIVLAVVALALVGAGFVVLRRRVTE